MKVIGLTGGIASGKSTVAKQLLALGYTVIDADVAAREVVKIGTAGLQEIIDAFGKDILHPDGSLNRTSLANIIFKNEKKRQELNKILHPKVRQWMLERKSEAEVRGEELIFMDIPLLYESNLVAMVDQVILVWVSPKTQIQRLIQRNQLSEAEAMQRINSQLPLWKKKELADFVIDNEGIEKETKKQLHEIIKSILNK